MNVRAHKKFTFFIMQNWRKQCECNTIFLLLLSYLLETMTMISSWCSFTKKACKYILQSLVKRCHVALTFLMIALVSYCNRTVIDWKGSIRNLNSKIFNFTIMRQIMSKYYIKICIKLKEKTAIISIKWHFVSVCTENSISNKLF